MNALQFKKISSMVVMLWLLAAGGAFASCQGTEVSSCDGLPMQDCRNSYIYNCAGFEDATNPQYDKILNCRCLWNGSSCSEGATSYCRPE